MHQEITSRLRVTGASLVLIVVLFASARSVQAASAPGLVGQGKSWQIVSSPNTSATYNWFSGVAALSANDVWAVGQAQYYPSPLDPLVEHWDGSAWSIISTPSTGTYSAFNAITTIPGTHQLWAVGTWATSKHGQQGLAELWNGNRWKITHTAIASSSVFSGVTAFSTTDAWAVGNYYQSSQMPNAALIEHWNGTQWSQVPAAYPSGSQHSFLNSIIALSATNVWAVGSYDNGIESPGYTLVEHWDGTQWSIVSSPSPASNNNVLLSLSSIPGTSNLLAAGYTFDGTNTQSLVEAWNGSSWSVVTTPAVGAGSQLYSVSALSAKSAWVVGDDYDGQGNTSTLLEHWNGKTWSVVSSPNPSNISMLYGLAKVPHSGTLWAVGAYYDSQSDELTLIEQYN
ncbi:MAG TPA: hypothetical protein VKV20_06090 [Ktedonobacteraceae bacterium]|jgi:hypothetical protein|nr:hypothetical protein [Ktedonobacteraceae bacterium]